MVKTTLTIGGSDTWGGGGIQTDLKTFENLQVFGLSTLTCIALEKENNFYIEELPADLVKSQLETIEKSFELDGLKIGLLASVDTIQVVIDFCQRNRGKFPIILDPVLAFKESDQRYYKEYMQKLKKLISFADLVTPNLTEMKMLLDLSTIQTVTDMKTSCQQFVDTFQTAVFLKGGNQIDDQSAIDYYLSSTEEKLFSGPISTKKTINGAGCCLSSAICANLALNRPLLDSLAASKKFVYQAIEQGVSVDQAGNVWHPQ